MSANEGERMRESRALTVMGMSLAGKFYRFCMYANVLQAVQKIVYPLQSDSSSCFDARRMPIGWKHLGCTVRLMLISWLNKDTNQF